MKREDIIREVMTMIPAGGYQVAKAIVKLADLPDDTFRRIGPKHADSKRSMSSQEAKRIVEAAKNRIALADAPD